MSDVQAIHSPVGTKTVAGNNRGSAMVAVSNTLSLAAAPVFGIMALLTGGGMPDMLCSVTHDASPLSGMVPMYVLMSIFHSSPWLKLISGRQEEIRPK